MPGDLELGKAEALGYAVRSMINFTRAFNLAWERMMIILFQPFQLGKWFTIGFGAFLAGLLGGGNGFNGTYRNQNWFHPNGGGAYNPQLHQQLATMNGWIASLQSGFGIAIAASIFLLILMFILLIYWLGARGQFLFLDNVVRNRGAIALPWAAYAPEAKSLFRFYLLYFFCSFLILIPFLTMALVLGIPLFRQHRWPEGGELALVILIGLAYLALVSFLAVGIFLFRELGVPLMFRHRLRARDAFVEVWKLSRLYPVSLALFVLLRIALFVALIITSVVVCCATCCLEVIPYLGTVLLLPALIYIKCFTLDFLAQFGPDYDVWTVDVVPAANQPSESTSLPPPLE